VSITVFLADDHAVVRDGLRLLLAAQPDIEVIGDAASGAEATRLIARRCPDVVIVDIAMPDMDGIEVTRRALEACPATRVIILSIHAAPEYVFRAFKAGASGYALKEAAGSEVVRAAREVYAGRRYLSGKIAKMVLDEFLARRESAEAKSPVARLSPRELEILKLVVIGQSSAQIAERLSLSPKTVDTYRSRLMEKLGIDDLPALVKFAIQHGLTSLE
jgi:DNA-binding NarL/FixJ family response regulator